MEEDNVETKFKKYIKEEKLNISTIEDIMLEDLENYKEELLLKEINGKDLISKKRLLE